MIEEHRDRVWHYILSRGVPASDAEDIFQEIWLAFWQKQDHPNPIGLLYRIASNKIADYWRRNPPLSEDIDPDTSAQEIQDLDSIQRKLYLPISSLPTNNRPPCPRSLTLDWCVSTKASKRVPTLMWVPSWGRLDI